MKRCTICEEDNQIGIHLYASFICTTCEYNIIHTDPREERYNYYVRKLKNSNQSTLYS